MCSGCSDYFEGDGEDQTDSALPEREAESPERFAAGRVGGWQARSGAAKGTMRDGDDYEVLVSAECIIERHTIRANCCALNQQEATEATEIWQESQPERTRSLAGTAKYYRTRGRFQSEHRPGRGTGDRCLMLWGLAGATALVLALWLAIG